MKNNTLCLNEQESKQHKQIIVESFWELESWQISSSSM